MRTNKPSIGGLIRVHVNSIVNEVLSTVSREFIFALRKNSPNAPKLKTNDFHPLKSSCAPKIVAFVVFCFLNFFLLDSFYVWRVFYAQNFFVKKKKLPWNCPDNLIYYSTVNLRITHFRVTYYSLFLAKIACYPLHMKRNFTRAFNLLILAWMKCKKISSVIRQKGESQNRRVRISG